MTKLLAAIYHGPFTGERRREADSHRKLALAFGLLLVIGMICAAFSTRNSTAWTVGLILVSFSTIAGALHFLYRILRGATHPQLLWREYRDTKKRSSVNTSEVERYIAEQKIKAAK